MASGGVSVDDMLATRAIASMGSSVEDSHGAGGVEVDISVVCC